MAAARKDRRAVVLFEDEMTAQLTPTLTRMWGLKTHQPEPGMWIGTRQKTHVFGALDAKNGRFLSMQAQWINAGSFIRFLRKVAKVYKGRKIMLILDNARWHKAKKVQTYLDGSAIALVFLPPYCPKMNPVEKVWKLFRKSVTHNYFHETLVRMVWATANFFRSLRKEKCRFLFYCRNC